jgi:hypothetical protein
LRINKVPFGNPPETEKPHQHAVAEEVIVPTQWVNFFTQQHLNLWNGRRVGASICQFPAFAVKIRQNRCLKSTVILVADVLWMPIIEHGNRSSIQKANHR